MSDPTHAVVIRGATAPAASLQMSHMSPIIQKMLETNPTPETMREILAFQRDLMADAAKRAYTTALVNLRSDLPAYVEKDQVVDFTGSKGRVRYTHASLAQVVEAVLPAMAAHGFAHSWIPATDSKGVSVTCSLTHREGHSESCTLSAPVDASGGKSSIQGVASSITLLQRYTLTSLLGLATADHREPTGQPAEPSSVNASANLRAMGAIQRAGRTRQEAEALVGRMVPEWTSADLDKLREWISPKAAEIKKVREDIASTEAQKVRETPAPPSDEETAPDIFVGSPLMGRLGKLGIHGDLLTAFLRGRSTLPLSTYADLSKPQLARLDYLLGEVETGAQDFTETEDGRFAFREIGPVLPTDDIPF